MTGQVSPEASPQMLKKLESRALAGPLPQVLVLPSANRGGLDVYSELDLEAVKIARAAGVEAEFLDGADEMRFLGEYSASVAISLAIAVAETLTVDGVKAVAKYVWSQLTSMHRRGLIEDIDQTRVDISVQRITLQPSQHSIVVEGLQISAVGSSSVSEVARAITDSLTAARALLELDGPSSGA